MRTLPNSASLSDGTEERYSFSVAGMTCAACVRAVEGEIRRVPGVKFVSVHLGTEKVFVVAESGTDPQAIREAVRRAGYRPLNRQPPEAEEIRFRQARNRLVQGLALGVAGGLVMFLHMNHWVHGPLMVSLEAFLGMVTLVVPGRGTLKGAWTALTHRHANMDTLITLACVAALLSSPLSLIFPKVDSMGGLGAMLMAFHLAGRYLETRWRWRATGELRKLLSSQDQECGLLQEDGSVQPFPVRELQPGMRVMLRPGERVAADGTVLEGSLVVDESLVTGEPVPVARAKGDRITGGSVVVEGTGVLAVEAAGETGFLTRVLRLIEQAQGIRLPIQTLADRFSGSFVPVVFSLATLGGLLWTWWEGPAKGLSVWIASLVISCPCAVGLAVPMALVVINTAASRRGILIRSAEALQVGHAVTAVVLDKTGTLTWGRPKVIACTVPEEYRALAAALASRSLHPLAHAVREHAGPVVLPEVEQVREIPGEGVEGVWAKTRYWLGRPHEEAQEGVWSGRTLVALERDGRTLGVYVLEDPLKADARDAIAALKGRKLRVILATGDRQDVARAVAERLGIEEVRWRLLPQDKFDLVKSLRGEGHRVMMVGDGLNDVAALKVADVGVAMGRGAALSAETADVVLIHSNPTRLVDVMDLSHVVVAQIRANLVWAFLYNILAVPLALAGWVHPLLAEGAMILSSVSVILASLWLERKLRIQEVRNGVGSARP